MTKENIESAIKNNVDIISLSFNHFHLGNPIVAPLFKLALQLFWSEFVEYYITDAEKIYSILSANPEVKAVLDTPAGRDYINRCCKYSYDALYDFTWSEWK